MPEESVYAKAVKRYHRGGPQRVEWFVDLSLPDGSVLTLSDTETHNSFFWGFREGRITPEYNDDLTCTRITFQGRQVYPRQ
jgi:hypothetical protein